MGEAGVKLLGEIGLGGVKAGDEAKQMVDWARKYGIQSTIHTGGPSIPGSGLIDKDVVLEAGAALHIPKGMWHRISSAAGTLAFSVRVADATAFAACK